MSHFIRLTITTNVRNVHKDDPKNEEQKRREVIVNLIKATNKISLSTIAKKRG